MAENTLGFHCLPNPHSQPTAYRAHTRQCGCGLESPLPFRRPNVTLTGKAKNTHNLVLYLAHEHTRGLEGQPPVQYEHEVVTGDGVVDTLLQATR